MLIGRVLGSVVSTAKDPGLNGHRLQLVEATDAQGVAAKSGSKRKLFVAVDGAGAGTDELVLVATGSAARQGQSTTNKPIDALIVGVIDSVDIQGTDVFRKS